MELNIGKIKDKDFILSVNELGSLYILGQSGSGKSFLSRNIIENFIKYDNTKIIAMDRKQDVTWKKLKETYSSVESFREVESFKEVLKNIRKEILRREDILLKENCKDWNSLINLYSDNRKDLKGLEWNFVLIDEWTNTLSEMFNDYKEDFEEFLGDVTYILENGINLGFSLILLSQRMTARNNLTSGEGYFLNKIKLFDSVIHFNGIDIGLFFNKNEVYEIPNKTGDFILKQKNGKALNLQSHFRLEDY